MHRDMQLILKILRYVQSAETPGMTLDVQYLPGHSPEQIKYHVQLCRDAGFLQLEGDEWIRRLTWAGHEFLEKHRDDVN